MMMHMMLVMHMQGWALCPVDYLKMSHHSRFMMFQDMAMIHPHT